MNKLDQGKRKKELGFQSNKLIPILQVLGIRISAFRSLKDQTIELGSRMTIISGRNGTMKTSIMGLIAHPFTGEAKDAFGSPLKTLYSEVFSLSPAHDTEDYSYEMVLETSKGILAEEVKIYYVAKKTNRHRVVVSGAEAGDGNFNYNTSFLNLKRLYPMVDTKAIPATAQALSSAEAVELKNFYESVFPSSSYKSFAPIVQPKLKTTFAPSGPGATYDWRAISSGEDNLGSIFNRLLGFMRAERNGNSGNGILCIDEFEASLHPVAQIQLFDYLLKWSQRYKVQVVITTHSLHLIQHAYLAHQASLDAKRIVINFISKAKASKGNTPILKNPTYEQAYSELTLETPEKAAEARKVRVFCEDDLAIHFVRCAVGKRDVLKLVALHSSLAPKSGLPGTSYSSLASLCINYPALLEHSFVVFDADVPDTKLAKIKDKKSFVRLPDPDNLGLERRIVHFICSLENDDEFFSKFNREQEAFLRDFKLAGIISLTPADILDDSIVSMDSCKAWANSDVASFKKYVTHYCHTIDTTEFLTAFVDRINQINSKVGIPPVNIG
ncbi:TPA: ATP-dependent endonuclease [Stenotrophomonas maltophilia]|uniref:ATP-dependent nuclease n=1 Tax=Stenotrophomonas maltophilia TaxID=40324 RepID=UPI0013044455|nr:ATP-binding protein [Stenotrophomonas maltophilia]HDS1307987.1 AAA family ATPase [Stenotrophomonas maltophilia]HDS1312526.1 AAA family ATPase [Stenotrophomonas maltophilia]HDS1317256.1 AAA family ATPase [Stenotrophomonas maltophilia]HDS1442142.1 AAA family ATPase [Stenotrophomonas maltophilia]HDS1514401.1 AAA family ATPase [Stenotrophomonas maltophilia]